jgi:hypothetical protein
MASDLAAAMARQIAEAQSAAALAAAGRVLVRFSSGGLAFTAKGQPDALHDAEADLTISRQAIRMRGQHPRAWTVSVDGTDDLRARLAHLRRGPRRLRWTPEDAGVFAASALWTYLTLPLLVPDANPRIADDGRRVHLDLGHIAGHGRRHTLHLAQSGLIIRHDYTAQAFGRWAHAAQKIDDHRSFDDVVIGARRRVTPRLARWRLPGPTLVWIDLHDVSLTAI